MNAIEVLKLVRSAPTGRMDSINALSQDSASLHPGLFSIRPPGEGSQGVSFFVGPLRCWTTVTKPFWNHFRNLIGL
jgi:hypothetical protein